MVQSAVEEEVLELSASDVTIPPNLATLQRQDPSLADCFEKAEGDKGSLDWTGKPILWRITCYTGRVRMGFSCCFQKCVDRKFCILGIQSPGLDTWHS